MNKDEIIASLQEEMKRQGISRYELAKRAGVPRSSLQRMYDPSWSPLLDNLILLAAAAGMEVVIQVKGRKSQKIG